MANNAIVQENPGIKAHPPITTLEDLVDFSDWARLKRLQEHLCFQSMEKIKVRIVFAENLVDPLVSAEMFPAAGEGMAQEEETIGPSQTES